MNWPFVLIKTSESAHPNRRQSSLRLDVWIHVDRASDDLPSHP